jgi:hypothetical protein
MDKPKQLTTGQFVEFLNSINDMKKYSATIYKEAGIEYPTINLSFATPEKAQMFLRRILDMSTANKYETSVYVEDMVPEIFEKHKPGKPKREVA